MNSEKESVSKLAGELKRDGYLILENAVDHSRVDAICGELAPQLTSTSYCQGAFFGPETKRLGRVLARAPSSRALVLDDLVYGIVSSVLQPNCHSLQLSLTQLIEICPGAVAQGPHRDQDMWWAPKGAMEYMVNVMWALDDFTERNGATRLWPGSNHLDPHDPLLPEEDAIWAEMPKGSACLFLGSTVHSGGANRSARSRRGLIISYCLGWLKPWENQWLAYPPHIARNFEPELAALVGYSQHRPSLCNYEGQCPSVLLTDDEPWQPFVDALLPEQVALVDEYRAVQLETLAAA
jgi:ectoine hydroxylase-related dioxygenase (phytanoyl-CoA dioxygenase family)